MTFTNNRATNAYRNVGLQTRAPQHDQYELVVMMFESVLESIARARGAIEAADTAAKVQHIGKAVRVVQEGLRTSLDLDNGGELAANLANLYDYSVMRMTQANASNDVHALEEVSQLIKPLAEAWRQMRADTTQQNPAPSATQPTQPAKKNPYPNAQRMGQVYGAGLAFA